MLAVLDWQRGDCASALPHFEKASSLVEQNPEAKREYASCLLAEGEAARSVDLYRQLMEDSPNTQTRLQFAVALWRAKQLDEHSLRSRPSSKRGQRRMHMLLFSPPRSLRKRAKRQKRSHGCGRRS